MSISFLNLGNSPKIKDSDWIANCFMLSAKNIPEKAYKIMMTSSADWKFTDTRLGGNIAINNPPAYTRFADPRASGLNKANAMLGGMKAAGMGQYWSDQIDNNSQIIHIQFGVPTYRGMLSFFTGASNIEAGLLARTGRVSISFFVGKLVGFVVGLRLLPFILAGTVIKFLINRTGSRYYNLKPAMHPYWNRVNFIANMIAVSEGLVDGVAKTDKEKSSAAGSSMEDGNNGEVKKLIGAAHSACPELFLPDGGVDVYRVASRYQELANARRKFLETVAEKNNVDDLLARVIEYSYVQKYDQKQEGIEKLREIHNTEYGSAVEGGLENDVFTRDSKAAMEAAFSTALGGSAQTADEANAGAQPVGETGQTNPTSSSPSGDPNYVTFDGTWKDNGGTDPKTAIERKPGWFENWWNHAAKQGKAGFDGAFSWVAFRVNATGSVSASFSNSTTTPEIKSAINSFSSSAAKTRFNFSQGATGIPGLDTVMSGLKEAVLGFADGVSLMGLVSLAGSSFIDIPDTWEDSSANLPSESYEIHLRSPYGNTLSRYMNIHIPLSMLLAGALPISTGRQTYASPFICKLISVGRSNMDLAMIDSLSVTHGVGNLGFNREKKPLGVDVSLTFKDLNRSVHAPIDTGGSMLNPLNAMSVFDDDNSFNYYINTLCGVSVADQVLATRRLERNVRLKMMQYNTFFSTSHLTLAVTESAPGRALRSIASAASFASGGLFAAPGMNKIQ